MNLKRTLFALTLLAVSATASANLVTNGDFETAPFGTGVSTGWSASASIGDTFNGGVFLSTNGYGGSSSHVYTNSSTSSISLSQHFLTATTLGSIYDFVIDLRLIGTDPSINVLFNGVSILTVTSTGSNWQEFTGSFTGTGNINSELIIQSASSASYGGTNYIDNVSVVLAAGQNSGSNAPEPGALALMALGLGVLGFARRRQA